MADPDAAGWVKVGPAADDLIPARKAAAMLSALFRDDPELFGYYHALATTGHAPRRPRKPREAAPDGQA